MSLDWDITRIPDDVCSVWVAYDPRQHGSTEGWDPKRIRTSEKGDVEVRVLSTMTEGLIWTTMAVGMGRITEENAREFYARAKIMELIDGAMVHSPEGPVGITPEIVRNHIGLRTNVSYETREEWARRHFIGHGENYDSEEFDFSDGVDVSDTTRLCNAYEQETKAKA